VLFAARAEWRRQDDDVADDRRPAAAGHRQHQHRGDRCARRSGRGQAADRLGVRRADDLRQADAIRISRIRRRPLAHRRSDGRGARPRADRLARPRPARAGTLRRLLQGHAAEGGARRRAGARPQADHPRRAADRPRCRLRAAGQDRAARARRRRRHRHHDDAHPRSRRTDGRPHRPHRQWSPHRGRHARRTAASVRFRLGDAGRHLPQAGGGRRGRVSRTDTLTWLAAHELRLGWRDWLSLMTAGRRRRLRTVVIVLTLFGVFMHLVAYGMVARYADARPDLGTLVTLSGTLLLSFSLLLSQAMESVTRAFYTRSDLELILTAPVSPRKVFAVRIARIAVAIAAMAMLIALPFIDVLVVIGGLRWLAGYGVVAAMGAVAASLGVAITVALFRTIGPRRTRFVAQVLAAVIGAAFVIGLQVAAILSFGSLSRFAPLQSPWLLAHVPGMGSPLWWPARAALGDVVALAPVLAFAIAVLALTIVLFSPRFGEHAIAASGVSQTVIRQRMRGFRLRSPKQMLRRKEWTLLVRDPWLMSQTLMQILYLLPPALLLWRSFHEGSTALVVLVPVVVMAAGQLAGGLAWLSISG